MKRTLLWTTLVLSILLCTGCVGLTGSGDLGADTNGKLDNIPFSEHHSYAVAHLGYLEPTDLDFYAEKYLDSDKLPTYYISSGDYYLVIPRYSGMALSLYQNDVETSASALLLQDPDCRPFILQCNASDIFADATVCLTYNGKSVEFSPFISLKDGSIDVGANGLDITKRE